MPRPTTNTVSPSVGAARRTPCMAIAPSVTVLATRVGTSAGMCTARFTGTLMSSA